MAKSWRTKREHQPVRLIVLLLQVEELATELRVLKLNSTHHGKPNISLLSLVPHHLAGFAVMRAIMQYLTMVIKSESDVYEMAHFNSVKHQKSGKAVDSSQLPLVFGKQMIQFVRCFYYFSCFSSGIICGDNNLITPGGKQHTIGTC